MTREQLDAWYEGEPPAEVRFGLNDGVVVLEGPHRGRGGSVISLERLDPEPAFLVEFGDDGSSVVLSQTALQLDPLPTPDASPSITVEHAHPTRRLDEGVVTDVVRRVLDGEGVRAREVTVVLADHATVLDLNRTWLGHDYTTDVLSFNLDEDALADGAVEGEVYVDLDTAAERAPEFGAAFEAEALRYVVHGVLHLVGYDDATPAAKAHMHALEDRYLRSAK